MFQPETGGLLVRIPATEGKRYQVGVGTRFRVRGDFDITASYEVLNDRAKDPPVNTLTGFPIYKITSTGIKGGDRRRIVAEVIEKPVNTNIRAALAADQDIRFIGNAVVCGYNHSADTPNPTGENGRGNSPDCAPWENVAGDLPASWTTQDTWNGGAAGQTGVAPINVLFWMMVKLWESSP